MSIGWSTYPGQSDLASTRRACGPPSCSSSCQVLLVRQRRTCRTRRGLSTAVAAAQAEDVELPQSQAAAVGQARSAALAAFSASQGPKSKQSFKRSKVRRLSLEIPLADDSAQAVANLAQEFLQAIPDNFQDGLSIIASRDDVAQLAALRLPKLNIVSASARRLPTSTKYVLLLGLSRPQIPDIKKLLANSRAEVFILINTSADGEVDNAVQNFASTFETAYCFEPIAIKAFVLTTDGVIFKNGADSPWFIMKRDILGRHKSIGRMQTRPQQQDLEAAFLNAAAVDSPVNRGIGAVKGLFARKSA